MSETSQQTAEKFADVASRTFPHDIVSVLLQPWSEKSPLPREPGRCLALRVGSIYLDEQELEIAMEGKAVVVIGITSADSEEAAANRVLEQFKRFRGICLLIAHFVPAAALLDDGARNELLKRHDRLLAMGVDDVLMAPDLNDRYDLLSAVNIAVGTWKTNNDNMQRLLSSQRQPLSETEANALKQQHQHLLWNSIPRALMPHLSLAKTIPNESEAGIGNFIFGEKFATEVGIVTRACDTSKDNETVVVKIVDKNAIFMPEGVEGIYREIRFLTEILKHPNIARCREHLHTHLNVYLIFDFAGDHHLAAWLADKPGNRFDDKGEVLHCFKEVVSGVAYCHSKDTAHRNMTLKHVVIQAKPNGTLHCTIVDFRRAVVTHNSALSTINIGTLPYTPPEAILGAYRPLGADCWSVGIMLLEMAGGMGSTFRATCTTDLSSPAEFKSALEKTFEQDGAVAKALTSMGANHDSEICQLLGTLLVLQQDGRGSMQSILSMIASQP